ncbi:N-acetylmannosamine-6-phosphate 2-epimerase [Evansella halocellulosilytica]|uniref:N-acetylmannosamine-6-phosphate 2-epimerase n=1 Tax=Evansella halocellulosilytica TaxID=2011013 RepID=UPI000BB6DD9E|nr:N-acetylmannosamine-6-phosphate 2-epimerase [Evansella halocellulosilytica]
MHKLFKQLRNKLVVSCQALEDEPLHSSMIMGRMALAAKEGGANAIRANGYHDIIEIKKHVELPVIGIVKAEYTESDVFITPTIKEIKQLLSANVDMIALDATNRKRPGNHDLDSLYQEIRQLSPNTPLMADISTIEEAVYAEKLGFDCVATTLVGYTEHTKGQSIVSNQFALLKKMTSTISKPVIAEGGINTPDAAKLALDSGAHFVVVGSAITRPQLITANFVTALK